MNDFAKIINFLNDNDFSYRFDRSIVNGTHEIYYDLVIDNWNDIKDVTKSALEDLFIEEFNQDITATVRKNVYWTSSEFKDSAGKSCKLDAHIWNVL